MERVHIHLPITRANGDLLPFVDVTLLHEDGSLVTSPVFEGPEPTSPQIRWPVTFAPANVDLWIEEVGRYDLHLTGPDGFSGVVQAVDFLPPPEEQVWVGTPQRVTNIVQEGRWLRQEGGILRWLDPGLIAAHTHDGGTANSTLLESVDSDPDHTLLGKAATSGGTGSTVVAALSSTLGANSTVVGPDSDGAVGGTILGDHSGSGQPSDAVWLSYGVAGATDAQVDSDSVVLRALDVEPSTAQIGTALPVGSGVTNPVWVRGDAAAQGLDARKDVVLGSATGVLGLFGADGVVQATRPAGATGALASLLDALQAYGLIAP